MFCLARRHRPTFFSCALMVLLGGCRPSNNTQPAAGGSSGQDQPAALKIIPARELPRLSDYIPAKLDGDRIEIAGPDDWFRAPRSDQYLARFHLDRNREVPRIVIKASAARIAAIDTVTPDNVVQFATELAQELEREGLKPEEPVKPMIVGDVAAARYVLSRRLKQSAVQSQVLVTQFDGRTYTLDLSVYRGKINQYKNEAYAVLASLRFHRPAPAAGGGASN